MGENADDEQRAAEFWRMHGLDAEALENPSEPFSRRPDLRLLRDNAPWAYCEVKTIAPHNWKIRILHPGRPPEERLEAGNRPLPERISGDLVTAVRQLNAGNPCHSLLNFVVLVNRDPEALPSILPVLLAAPAAPSGRSLQARRAARLAEEVRSFRRNVDLCFWAKPAAERGLVIEKCFLFNPALRSFAEEVTGLRADKLISLEPAA
jgi:hypothetical protein